MDDLTQLLTDVVECLEDNMDILGALGNDANVEMLETTTVYYRLRAYRDMLQNNADATEEK